MIYRLLKKVVAPYTSLSSTGMDTLAGICRGLPPGAIVECGVASGGAAAFLWAITGANRHLWLYDSWQGLPRPVPEDGPRAHAKHARMMAERGSWCLGSISDVIKALQAVDCPLDFAHFMPGWFSETVPETCHKPGEIALLHLDGDFYESTATPLRYFWPYIVPGGVVIFDDYDAWEGCRRAADEFCEAMNVTIEKGVIRK